jgi:hypothetical protein
MTDTPSVQFAVRPTPPSETDTEYLVWSKRATLNYDGGYIEAAYGDLIQTWSLGESNACTGKTKRVERDSYFRTNTIGGFPSAVAATDYDYTVYPKRNSSLAAGGELFTIHTAVGSYTANVGGDVQTMIAYICTKTNQLYDPIQIQSSSGAWYGPFVPSN